MSERDPDFTDVFYAKARCRHFAKLGLRLADEGKTKEARAAYDQALHWEKESVRLEALKNGIPQLSDLARRASPTARKARPARGGAAARTRSAKRKKSSRSPPKPSRR